MYTALEGIRWQSPEFIDRAAQILLVSRYLERIAGLSTNIEKDSMFMVGGELIWHQGICRVW